MKGGRLVHHSDRGSQYVSIKYTERLAEAGIEPSVGSVGDSYDNALAETINGLYKAEVIHRRGPWRSFEAVEFATLEWVDWFNNRRLLEPIGNIPPAEAEERYYAMLKDPAMAARLKRNGLRKARGGSASRRKGGRVVGAKLMSTIARDVVEDEDDDFVIVTGNNQRISQKEVFIRQKVTIDRHGKSVLRDSAWKALRKFEAELKESGIVAQ